MILKPRSNWAAAALVDTNLRSFCPPFELHRTKIAQRRVPPRGIIEARDVNEVVELVAKTPCARAKGAIEIRPIMGINDEGWRERSWS